jgi:hypothetical protein
MSLLGILIALIVIGLLLWAIRTVLGVIAIPEPFKTIVWVIVVVVACLMFLQMSGLYHFNINLKQ